MQPATLKGKMNLSNAKALRRAREMMKVTRLEMSSKLNFSLEAIKKYESGRAIIDEEKINKWLLALELTPEDFIKIKESQLVEFLKRLGDEGDSQLGFDKKYYSDRDIQKKLIKMSIKSYYYILKVKYMIVYMKVKNLQII
jgi:transcriptional regulator with XRE-family HTH domain